jgi:hypothetical protein
MGSFEADERWSRTKKNIACFYRLRIGDNRTMTLLFINLAKFENVSMELSLRFNRRRHPDNGRIASHKIQSMDFANDSSPIDTYETLQQPFEMKCVPSPSVDR